MSELLVAASILFNSALADVNEDFQQQQLPYRIELSQPTIDPKQPIRLKAIYANGEELQIGVVHLIKLEGDRFDERLASPDFYPAEWEKIALTVDQVREDIFARVALYFAATQDSSIFINKSNGTLFKFGECNVVIANDGTFVVDGKKIMYREVPLQFSRIVGQYVIEFKRLQNGHVQLLTKGDKRTGKGIYIDAQGNIYRA